MKPIIDSAGAQKPIAAFLVPEAPDALARLSAAGVPNFHTPEACADAIAAALGRREPRRDRWRASQPAPSASSAAACSMSWRLMRCSTSSACRTRQRRARCERAKAPALPFPYPVAVKALSAEIAHKSDVGGVVLNVRDDAALLAAIKSQIAQAHQSRRACWCSR